jgi:hypothetical protein
VVPLLLAQRERKESAERAPTGSSHILLCSGPKAVLGYPTARYGHCSALLYISIAPTLLRTLQPILHDLSARKFCCSVVSPAAVMLLLVATYICACHCHYHCKECVLDDNTRTAFSLRVRSKQAQAEVSSGTHSKQ